MKITVDTKLEHGPGNMSYEMIGFIQNLELEFYHLGAPLIPYIEAMRATYRYQHIKYTFFLVVMKDKIEFVHEVHYPQSDSFQEVAKRMASAVAARIKTEVDYNEQMAKMVQKSIEAFV